MDCKRIYFIIENILPFLKSCYNFLHLCIISTKKIGTWQNQIYTKNLGENNPHTFVRFITCHYDATWRNFTFRINLQYNKSWGSLEFERSRNDQHCDRLFSIINSFVSHANLLSNCRFLWRNAFLRTKTHENYFQ